MFDQSFLVGHLGPVQQQGLKVLLDYLVLGHLDFNLVAVELESSQLSLRVNHVADP